MSLDYHPMLLSHKLFRETVPLNLRKNLRILIPIKNIVKRQFLDPYRVQGPKSHDLCDRGHFTLLQEACHLLKM
jgi:hypothetical protein